MMAYCSVVGKLASAYGGCYYHRDDPRKSPCHEQGTVLMSKSVRASQFQDAVGGNTDLLLALPLKVSISCYKLVIEKCRCDAQRMVFHNGLHEQGRGNRGQH